LRARTVHQQPGRVLPRDTPLSELGQRQDVAASVIERLDRVAATIAHDPRQLVCPLGPPFHPASVSHDGGRGAVTQPECSPRLKNWWKNCEELGSEWTLCGRHVAPLPKGRSAMVATDRRQLNLL